MDSRFGIGKEIVLDLESQRAVGVMIKKAEEQNDVAFVREILKSVYLFLENEKNIDSIKNNIKAFVKGLPEKAKSVFLEKIMSLSHIKTILFDSTEENLATTN